MHTVTSANPTEELSVSFREYVQQRKSASNRHLQGGIADYAFGSDFSLRQKIRSIPGFYALAKSITIMAASVSGSTESVTSVIASLSLRPGVSMMVTPFLQ